MNKLLFVLAAWALGFSSAAFSGANVSNVGHFIDYSTGETYIDLHRRIYVPESMLPELKKHLESKNWEEVKKILKSVAPANAESTIDVMLSSEALLLSSEKSLKAKQCPYKGSHYSPGTVICINDRDHKCKSNGRWTALGTSKSC